MNPLSFSPHVPLEIFPPQQASNSPPARGASFKAMLHDAALKDVEASRAPAEPLLEFSKFFAGIDQAHQAWNRRLQPGQPPLSQEELLCMQRDFQELAFKSELASKVIDQVTSAAKTILQTQA